MIEHNLPFKIDLTKMSSPIKLENIDGFVTDYENGQQKIRFFQGTQEFEFVVLDREIYDAARKLKVGEY